MATATIDLLDQVKSLLTPDIVSKMASFVGETAAPTQKALGGMVPSAIAGLANQASTSNGAQQLARTLDSGGFTGPCSTISAACSPVAQQRRTPSAVASASWSRCSAAG